MDVFSDPGWEDAHRVNIDWGDGITDTVLKAAGEQEAEFSQAVVVAPLRRSWLPAGFKQ